MIYTDLEEYLKKIFIESLVLGRAFHKKTVMWECLKCVIRIYPKPRIFSERITITEIRRIIRRVGVNRVSKYALYKLVEYLQSK